MTTKTSTILSSKFKTIIATSLISLVIIISYLFHLQINLMPRFFHLGCKNFLRSHKVTCVRGNITDAKGKLLATNKPINTVYWQGTYQKKLTLSQIDNLLKIVSIINDMNITEDNISDILPQIVQAERRGTRIALAYDVPLSTLSRLLEQFPDNQNLSIEREFKRYYPHNSLACHVVGYLGLNPLSSELQGKMGLENIYEADLKGQQGEIISTINSYGRHLHSYESRKAQSGNAIHTTLDIDLQTIIEEVFPKEYSGACILMDPETGSIKSLFSYPSFNPNIFLKPISHNQWQDLQETECFINRACDANYPPASLFKLPALCCALEEEIIHKEQEWNCKGYTVFGKRRYHCAQRWGHGVLNTQQALAKSCNIPFFEIGKKVSIDKLAYYASLFGLGTKTSIKLQEKSGLIPTSLWKQQTKNERWWPGETLSAVIGQSFLLVTPLQIACMMSALCTGYKVQPRILVDEPIKSDPLPIKAETLDFLKQCTNQVVRAGTGSKLKQRLYDFTIYAKTGTAQTSDLSKRKLGGKYAEHAWFMAYLSYKGEKPLTLVILVEHAGSARVATATASRFLTRYQRLIENNLRLSKKSSP